MKPLRVVVLGGGPSGLYFAYLLKKSRPEDAVEVIEQNAPDATFGFGVVLADRGVERLEAVDPESAAALRTAMRLNRDQIISHNGVAILVDRVGYGGAIGRLKLLQILQECCRDVGVVVHFNRRVTDLAALGSADLIVGADGINSLVRSSNIDGFGTQIRRLTNHFAWYGTHTQFEHAGLSFKSRQPGDFVGHYYPYSDDMSTFVAECSDATWQQLGLEHRSDQERQRLIERVFAAELQGQPLIYNNSTWRQFPVVTNQRWSVGNHVLIGDAMQSAHFSIGSGTRVAIDDAIALWEAITNSSDVASALRSFGKHRAPVKAKLLDAARASYMWYESFAQKLESLPPLEFAYDFMTRTGRMDPERLRVEHPNFTARYERECLAGESLK